ncbi:hypothetical protein GF354_04260 [Candidatus Peregrinibacteria bacterium]|nr:hypothetical protein [Candidatus Peregrinibacteria bacterium]
MNVKTLSVMLIALLSFTFYGCNTATDETVTEDTDLTEVTDELAEETVEEEDAVEDATDEETVEEESAELDATDEETVEEEVSDEETEEETN